MRPVAIVSYFKSMWENAMHIAAALKRTGAPAPALLLSAAFVWGAAAAQDTGGAPGGVDAFSPGHPNYNALDIDRDGRLSKAEAAGRKGLLSNFLWADKNADNVIDRGEFAAFEDAYPGGIPSVDAPFPPPGAPMR